MKQAPAASVDRCAAQGATRGDQEEFDHGHRRARPDVDPAAHLRAGDLAGRGGPLDAEPPGPVRSVVTDRAKVVGILTERDLLRAAAAGADPAASRSGCG